MRGQGAGEREEYRKRAGMPKPDKKAKVEEKPIGKDDYGQISTTKNTGKPPLWSFASYSNPAKRILVTPTKTGSEKQQEFANNLKTRSMSAVDKMADNLITKGSNISKTTDWRNKLMGKIDKETNAKAIIDKLINIAGDAAAITNTYGVIPGK
jgi:hypothetical protein